MAEAAMMRIEPGAAERIAHAFEAHANNLEDVAARFRNQGFSTGFAGFPSAQELDAGFRNKAELAIEHLQHQAATARAHAASIRAAGQNYRATEAANMSSFNATNDAVPR